MSNSLFFSPELRTSLKGLSPPQSSWSITRPCSRLALFFPPGSLFHSDAIINHAGEDLVLVYSLLSVLNRQSPWIRNAILHITYLPLHSPTGTSSPYTMPLPPPPPPPPLLLLPFLSHFLPQTHIHRRPAPPPHAICIVPLNRILFRMPEYPWGLVYHSTMALRPGYAASASYSSRGVVSRSRILLAIMFF
ncbi:uncharacterized protein LAJ45_00065 [Morchella importuna]|uniref:uncharacterized protein n=1 Tax=Morchella importuna TaxID=1174673 RepID=UPI001E8E2509|nr:uncharacterized protein LAJ45_00065 [Morchella importuna]KAH8155056.1 hypothetical protein LAJ45_00065 [Morchella importuna]